MAIRRVPITYNGTTQFHWVDDETGRTVPPPIEPDPPRGTFAPRDAADFEAAKHAGIAGLPPAPETPDPAPATPCPEPSRAAAPAPEDADKWVFVYPGWDKWRQ